ncbi:MAG: hypothetical protein WC766_05200 [Patescibacteria group bacterium]|jgi:hypothetical protein
MKESFPQERPVLESKDHMVESRRKELIRAKEILDLVSREVGGTENSAMGKLVDLSGHGKNKLPDEVEAVYKQLFHFKQSVEELIRTQLGIKGDPEWDDFCYGPLDEYVSRHVDESSPKYIKPDHRRMKSWDE